MGPSGSSPKSTKKLGFRVSPPISVLTSICSIVLPFLYSQGQNNIEITVCVCGWMDGSLGAVVILYSTNVQIKIKTKKKSEDGLKNTILNDWQGVE